MGNPRTSQHAPCNTGVQNYIVEDIRDSEPKDKKLTHHDNAGVSVVHTLVVLDCHCKASFDGSTVLWLLASQVLPILHKELEKKDNISHAWCAAPSEHQLDVGWYLKFAMNMLP